MLKAFLDYAARKITNDSFLQKLDEAVEEAKQNREWRQEYMTLLMRDQINVEKGEDKLSQLIARLIEDKQSQDIIRATQDKEYRNKLYEEYLIDQ